MAKRVLEVSEETYQKIKEQLDKEDVKDISALDELVGGNYFFRAVTYHLVGKVTRKIGNIVKLEEASWIPDSGRFMQFIKNGTINECEPVGVVYLNLDSVVDFYPWVHELPKDQK